MKRDVNKIFLVWYGKSEFKIKPVEVSAWNKTEAKEIYAFQMGYSVNKLSAEFVKVQ